MNSTAISIAQLIARLSSIVVDLLDGVTDNAAAKRELEQAVSECTAEVGTLDPGLAANDKAADETLHSK